MDPRQYGEWIADIERPAAQYRGRYQIRLDEARALLGHADAATARVADSPGQHALAALSAVERRLGRRGLDGPALVQWAYRQSGIELPRSMQAQLSAPGGRPVRRDALLPGDLVFFRSAAGDVDQVGISLGGDRFMAAPRGVVEVSSRPGLRERVRGRAPLRRGRPGHDPGRERPGPAGRQALVLVLVGLVVARVVRLRVADAALVLLRRRGRGRRGGGGGGGDARGGRVLAAAHGGEQQPGRDRHDDDQPRQPSKPAGGTTPRSRPPLGGGDRRRRQHGRSQPGIVDRGRVQRRRRGGRAVAGVHRRLDERGRTPPAGAEARDQHLLDAVPRLRRRLRAPGRVLDQQALDPVRDPGVDPRVELAGGRRGLLDLLHEHGDLRVVVVERQPAGDEFDGDHADRVEVAVGPIASPIACSGDMYAGVPIVVPVALMPVA